MYKSYSQPLQQNSAENNILYFRLYLMFVRERERDIDMDRHRNSLAQSPVVILHTLNGVCRTAK